MMIYMYCHLSRELYSRWWLEVSRLCSSSGMHFYYSIDMICKEMCMSWRI